MAEFAYEGIGSKGSTSAALISAPNREAALNTLRGPRSTSRSAYESQKSKSKDFDFGKRQGRLKELVIFTRELSTMIDAGVPLPRGRGNPGGPDGNKVLKW